MKQMLLSHRKKNSIKRCLRQTSFSYLSLSHLNLISQCSGLADKRFCGKSIYVFTHRIYAGSILCSQAWDIGSLIGYRFLLGIGAGLLIPTLQSLLVYISGGRNLGRNMPVFSIPALLGSILSPVLGGIIINSLSWHWIFYVNIPISIIAIFLAWWGLPNDADMVLNGALLLIPLYYQQARGESVLFTGLLLVSTYIGLRKKIRFRMPAFRPGFFRLSEAHIMLPFGGRLAFLWSHSFLLCYCQSIKMKRLHNKNKLEKTH